MVSRRPARMFNSEVPSCSSLDTLVLISYQRCMMTLRHCCILMLRKEKRIVLKNDSDLYRSHELISTLSLSLARVRPAMASTSRAGCGLRWSRISAKDQLSLAMTLLPCPSALDPVTTLPVSKSCSHPTRTTTGMGKRSSSVS